MDSIERTMAAIHGEKYDRAPVIPLIIQHAMQVSGIPHGLYSTNAEMLAKAQLEAVKKYDYDGFHISSDNYVVSEALGNRVVFPQDEPPQKKTEILRDDPELSRLHTSFDPLRDGRMPVLIKATQIAREAAGNTKFIKANCDSGPFSVAASLRGEEKLFLDLFDNEQYVMDLMELTSSAIIRYAKALAAAGAHAITYGESTGGLLNRRMFEQIVLPFNQKVISEIKKTGLPVFYHMCGNVNHIVDLMAKTGADCIEIDSFTDLEKAYEATSRKLCIEGNLNTISVLLDGSVEDVMRESKKCIEISKGANLILSSGCELPRLTPAENVFAMVVAAKES